MVERLSEFPWVVVRVRCDLCGRQGEYRLARLAAKYGSEITLGELLDRIAHNCPWRDHSRQRSNEKYDTGCGAYFKDMDRPPRPPDLPSPIRKLTVITGGKS
jgi:hypothetical protein